MDIRTLAREVERLRHEVEQLRRSGAAKKLPLAETNIVKPMSIIDGLTDDGDASTGSVTPYFIDETDDNALKPHLDQAGNEYSIPIYNYGHPAEFTSRYYLCHRMPDGKRILAPAGCQTAIVRPDSMGVAARSGSVPGVGLVEVMKLVESEGPVLELQGTGVNITVYNLSETPCDPHCYSIAHTEVWGGRWIIQPPAVTDLQLDGYDFQLRRNCDWETWLTGSPCEDEGT